MVAVQFLDGVYKMFSLLSCLLACLIYLCMSQVINNCVQNLSQVPPPIPASLKHLIIPADSEYRLYEHQRGQFETFLLAETEPGNDAILIFGQPDDINFIKSYIHYNYH